MLKKAVEEISAADERMAAAIEQVGECDLLPRKDGAHFDHLVRAIVYQQLSGKAAATIHGRFLASCAVDGPLSPEAVLAAGTESLRSCGLSAAKSAALQDLALHVTERKLPLDQLATMSDDEIIQALVAVRGIGPWTAQMFLMFRLGRPNVLPVLDLGVRKGAQRIYNTRSLPDAARLEKLARKWRPWASVASWYCWRILDVKNI